MRVRHLVLAGVLAVALALAVPASASSASSASSARTWTYRAQVDGLGGKDAVTITAQPGFTINDVHQGTGPITVHVDFDTGGSAEVYLQSAGYLSVRSPWTPWLGATDLDHRPGKELVIGYSTGAHAQLFDAYAYRQGQLVELDSPLGAGWFINSSFGTGSSGWRCTGRGVEVRAVSTPRGGTVRVTVKKFVFTDAGWKRSGGGSRTVPVTAQGNPPAYTDDFPSFACRGLPPRVL